MKNFYSHQKNERHRITATITDKHGRILAQAQNNYNKSHPVMARFANATGQPSRIFLHAEIAALIRLKPNDKPFTIHVQRFTKDGKPAIAKPCPVCRAAIKHWGIQETIHT